ncbi:MAG: hypothetical protein AAF846_25625 [Chloroflexota bacterium]
MESFESMLTGGHPNSLGKTVEVVELVLADSSRVEELYQCYFSQDEVVRLRTSNAMKRLWRDQPDLIVPYIDRFIAQVSQIEQASAQWTLAQLFNELDAHLSIEQRQEATTILKRNLTQTNDWIVINNTLETLGKWATDNPALKNWLKPHVERFSGDSRKSIAKKSSKLAKTLYGA